MEDDEDENAKVEDTPLKQELDMKIEGTVAEQIVSKKLFGSINFGGMDIDPN